MIRKLHIMSRVKKDILESHFITIQPKMQHSTFFQKQSLNYAQTMACQVLQYCMWKYMCCISKYVWTKIYIFINIYICGLKIYICGLKNIFVDKIYICGLKNIFVD